MIRRSLSTPLSGALRRRPVGKPLAHILGYGKYNNANEKPTFVTPVNAGVQLFLLHFDVLKKAGFH